MTIISRLAIELRAVTFRIVGLGLLLLPILLAACTEGDGGGGGGGPGY